MLKKSICSVVVVFGLVGALVFGGEEISAKSPAKIKEEVITTNVGDGQEYAYKITEINGEEIHGVALNKKSFTNAGIFLYKEEVEFDAKVGDNIIVVWGEYEDEFVSIERAVKLKNGEYISKKRLLKPVCK